jgi:pyruvate dehydrogenase E1 component beta subunit
MLGLRPVMELMFFSFYSVAFDQIFNNAANIRYMSGGLINCPIVLRGPANGGTNVGATHSHTPESIAAYHPGIKVVVPSTPADAKGLLKSAIRDNDPVIFLENTLLYGETGEVPDGDITIPLGLAKVMREGTDISIIGHGRSIQMALKSADILKEKHNVNAEVIDLRSIRPLDEETILNSVKKTSRCLYVEEAKPFCSVGAMVACLIQEKAFDYLDAPVMRVNSIDAPAIYSPAVEKLQLPTVDSILQGALGVLK